MTTEEMKELCKNFKVIDALDSYSAHDNHLSSCYELLCEKIQKELVLLDIVDAIVEHSACRREAKLELAKFGITDDSDILYLRVKQHEWNKQKEEKE